MISTFPTSVSTNGLSTHRVCVVSFVVGLVLAAINLHGNTVAAFCFQPPIEPAQTADDSNSLDAILKQLVLDSIPHSYSESKDWGRTKRVYSGFHFRTDNSRLETKRDWRDVNDGTWRKFSAKLIDPSQSFEVKLSEVQPLPSGAIRFEIGISAPVQLHARQSHWVRGVQIYSLSVDGFARVQLAITCELTTQLDLVHLPPDIVLRPKVTEATISIPEFRIDRVSKVGGEIAQEVTATVRKVLDEKTREKSESLVAKLNRELERKRDRLRISPAEAPKLPWTAKAIPLMPETVRSELSK